MIAAIRAERKTTTKSDPVAMRADALRAIREYRRTMRVANAWVALDDMGDRLTERMNRAEKVAIVAVKAYARATRQRGPHPFVIDDRGDVIAYIVEAIPDDSPDFRDVFTIIHTRFMMEAIK